MTDISPNVLIFHHKTPQWHLRHKIGSHFLCDGQRYNHIPGHEHFVNKDEMGRLNRDYGLHYTDRKHCFDSWEFMPETLDLSDPEECVEFFERMNKDSDPGTIKWIKKKARGSHNAEGIEIVTLETIERLNRRYQQGARCDTIHDQYIVQKYIGNPLLLAGKKFDFRVYMVIASMDPLIILYHDGFLRVSLLDFDQRSNDTMAHVTNTQLAKDMLDRNKASEREKEETMAKQMWTFPAFESFMIEQGKVQPGWLDGYVRRVMKEKMLHLTRMVYEQLLRHPGVYELFGVDFMFDEDLKLWFLEVNRSPAMQATTEEKGRIQSKMTQDILEIELTLITGSGLDEAVERSGFYWIFDGRKSGIARYHNLLTPDCL